VQEFIVRQLEDWALLSSKLMSEHNTIRVFTLEGNLGAGKTTFVQQICKILGVENKVQSPTFSIINEYNYNDSKIYHMDLYRIKSTAELLEIGFEDYLFSGNYCFIEWSGIGSQLITMPHINILISVYENEIRKVNLQQL
jgi:tRNA threonylcarbamoyladenosine biosynthesis protein TsaE